MSFLFEQDPIEPWAYWDNLFSAEECKEIIKIGNSFEKSSAQVKNQYGGKIDATVRACKTSWIPHCQEGDFIYQKISQAIISLNERFFKFNLVGFTEDLQFTEYDEIGNFHNYHTDRGSGNGIRKLSAILQLTEPNEYDGAELELFYEGKPTLMKKDLGRLVVFPSYTLHRVLPLTKGTRHSLVGWVNGPPFK